MTPSHHDQPHTEQHPRKQDPAAVIGYLMSYAHSAWRVLIFGLLAIIIGLGIFHHFQGLDEHSSCSSFLSASPSAQSALVQKLITQHPNSTVVYNANGANTGLMSVKLYCNLYPKNQVDEVYGGNTTSSSGSSTSSNSSSSSDGHVGSTLQLGGYNGNLAITLNKVTDPSIGVAGEANSIPNLGSRFVSVWFTIANNTSTYYTSSVTNSIIEGTLMGSNNQSYPTNNSDVTDCNNFNSETSSPTYLAAGQDYTGGCLVFELPTGVNAAKVQINGGGDNISGSAEWKVN